MSKMLCVALIAAGMSLSSCASFQGQAEEYGAEAFEAMEQSSVTAVKAAKRYICKTARVEAVNLVFVTEEEKQGRLLMCGYGS